MSDRTDSFRNSDASQQVQPFLLILQWSIYLQSSFIKSFSFKKLKTSSEFLPKDSLMHVF